METKTHWKKLHNPDFLGAYSLDKDGQYHELNVIIESVKNDQVTGQDGKKDECIVAKIRGNKPLVLNATNCKILTKLFESPHIEDWTGKAITLYVAKVKAFGDVHDALRIKTVFPTITLTELNPSHPKWAGAKEALSKGNTTVEAIRKQYTLSVENEIELKK